jgi:hypothetical protein
LVVVANFHTHSTTGALTLPPAATVLCVYSGGDTCTDVEALKASVKELKGVTALEAENDLSIGNYTLAAGRLQVSKHRRYFLLFLVSASMTLHCLYTNPL